MSHEVLSEGGERERERKLPCAVRGKMSSSATAFSSSFGSNRPGSQLRVVAVMKVGDAQTKGKLITDNLPGEETDTSLLNSAM